MSIQYDKLSLLKLFGNKPQIIDEEARIFIHRIQDKQGFKFEICLSSYEDWITTRLEFDKNIIYDISIDNVIQVEAEKDSIKVFNEHEAVPTAEIMIVPNIMLFSSSFNLTTQSLQKNTLSRERELPVKYDEFGLMVLFCNDPKVIDQGEKILEYKIDDGRGFVLTLHFLVYDRCASVLLEFEGQQVYKVEVDQIVEIKAEKDHFKIFREHDDEDSAIKIMVVPNLTPSSSLFSLNMGL